MKLQINTTTKTIRLDEVVNMHELYGFVKKMFPNDWKQWKLDGLPNYGYVWYDINYIDPSSPFIPSFHTTCGGDAGIYNVSIN